MFHGIGVLSLIKNTQSCTFVKAIYTESDFMGLYHGLNLKIFDHRLCVFQLINKYDVLI